MIDENGNKKSYKYYNKANSCECKHIEHLIRNESECVIYPEYSPSIYQNFEHKSNPEYLLMHCI